MREKAEKLYAGITGIDDEILEAAQEGTGARPAGKRRRLLRRCVALAACLCLCICVSVPVAMAAADVEPAYALLYAVSPTIAQKLKPVNKSCTDAGIKMEVLSASVQGDSVDVLVSMQDLEKDRLDETADLFDSYVIHTPYDASGTCSLASYDAESRSAVFLIEIRQWAKIPVPGDKLTFSVNQLLTGKEHAVTALPQVDLAAVPQAERFLESPDFRGGTGGETAGLQVLEPGPEAVQLLPGVTLTGYGIVDGKLHVQLCYADITETDNHGFLFLSGPEGMQLSCANLAFWDAERVNSYEEYVFDIPAEGLEDYQLFGEFWTCSSSIHGNWQVTFPIDQD